MGVIQIPRGAQAVQGIPLGRLASLEARIKAIEDNGGGGGIGNPTSPTSGTVNGTNDTFGFSSKPAVVVSDGIMYRENFGWTWNGSEVVMYSPPNYDIFAL